MADRKTCFTKESRPKVLPKLSLFPQPSADGPFFINFMPSWYIDHTPELCHMAYPLTSTPIAQEDKCIVPEKSQVDANSSKNSK